MIDDRRLDIHMRTESISGWNFLLQKGFTLQGHAGVSVRAFLQEALGYDNCLIDESVRTIFLNSSPVDDIDQAHLKEGDRLALGSAMPGLVGICMGRDNPYKSFRSDISVKEENIDESALLIKVFVKIFSLLAVDTGVDVLKRGIFINAELLAGFLEDRMELVRGADGLDVSELIALLQTKKGDVSVTVEFS